MDTKLHFVVESRRLKLRAQEKALQIHASDEAVGVGQLFVLLFFLSSVIFLLAVFLPLSGLDVSSLECTAGVTLIFLRMEKGEI